MGVARNLDKMIGSVEERDSRDEERCAVDDLDRRSSSFWRSVVIAGVPVTATVFGLTWALSALMSS